MALDRWTETSLPRIRRRAAGLAIASVAREGQSATVEPPTSYTPSRTISGPEARAAAEARYGERLAKAAELENRMVVAAGWRGVYLDPTGEGGRFSKPLPHRQFVEYRVLRHPCAACGHMHLPCDLKPVKPHSDLLICARPKCAELASKWKPLQI